jgi:hypothetical protein
MKIPFDAEGRRVAGVCAVAAVAILSLGSQGTVAQDVNVKNLAVFTGQCRLQIVQGFFPCNPKVAYAQLANGRSLLTFQKDATVFTLSGGSDRQPNLQNYYLSIDTLRLNRGKRQEAEDRGMEGECHFSLNNDATVFYYVKCDVYNRAKGSMYNFYLEHITHTDHKRL